MGLLDGKVVLVTGSSGNVGGGIARTLTKHGADVAVHCLSRIDAANRVATDVQALGCKASVWQCDVRDPEAVQSMVAGVIESHGHLDAVVNNANQNARLADGWYIDEVDYEHIRDSTDVMARGFFNLLNSVLPHFRERGFGRVVNIISEHWAEGYSGEISSMSAEGALTGLTRRAAYWDFRDPNITINTVTRGWTLSPETKGSDDPENPYIKITPKRRIAEPEDVGNACALLISDLASSISGANIPVMGGRSPMGSHDCRDSVRANTPENGGRHPQAGL